jgi:hypothetical protein
MSHWLALTALAAMFAAAPVRAEGISGQYIEARNCDVWTGPCFANAEMNLTGKHAVLGWKVSKGTFDNVCLDGLGVVAVISASDTLGLEQTGPSKAVLIVDEKATSAQRAALVHLAQKEAGELTRKIIRVQSAKVDLEMDCCKQGGCARLEAGNAHIQTRCIDAHHDKICGNESAFYPPLSENVKAQPAVAVKHAFLGKAFNETWNDGERRGAYVGSVEIR